MSLINVTDLTKVYLTGSVKTTALRGVSFTIEQGEFVAIMGPSGSGKSTLMHILGALDTPTSGTYALDGANVEQMNDDERADIRNTKIGFVFQAYNLLPRTTAMKNVMLPMFYANVPKAKREGRARGMLAMVGLADRLEHKTNQLSGGQQQRVAIARALVMNPAIVLADEPTGNIASKQAAGIMAIFQKLNQDGHTILMITHDPEIAQYAKRVINIRDGELAGDRQNGRTQKIVTA